jgi:hypothetical protein
LGQNFASYLATYASGFGSPFKHGGNVLVLLGEIFLHVTTERFTGGQVGQYIDKTKELDLEVIVTHAPVCELSGPPSFIEYGRCFILYDRKEFLATGFDFPLKT